MKSTLSNFPMVCLFVLWGFAATPWLLRVKSYEDYSWQHLGFAIGVFAGLRVIFYISELEGEVRRLNAENTRVDAEARRWEDQAQFAIKLLSKRRKAVRRSKHQDGSVVDSPSPRNS